MMARLTAFASRIGLTGLAIAILVALLVVQTVRIEGLRVWPIKIAGYKARTLAAEQLAAGEKTAHAVTRNSLDRCAAAHSAYIDAGIKRRKALERALERQEGHSAALGRQIERIRAERAPARAPEAVAGVCETAPSVMQAEGL